MYVGLKMLRDFVKVTPDTLVKDAQKQLEDSKLWMLLVVDENGSWSATCARKTFPLPCPAS